MTSDGINDAPALAFADVGVAMGARRLHRLSEPADTVLTVDRLSRLGWLGDVAALVCPTGRIVRQSVLAGMGCPLRP